MKATDMLERFQGSEGSRLLAEAVSRQALVGGDLKLAQKLAAEVQLSERDAGATLIEQSAADNDLHFIIAGRVSVRVNGREVAIRHAGQHVGEMALIDPSARRCATVVARERILVATLSEPTFSKIASQFSEAWRRLAMELCDRLRQRDRFLLPPNPRPVLFLGSSSEGLPIARALQLGLKHDDFLVRVWTDHVFGASHFPIESLEIQLSESDFALLVLGPDDRVESRGHESDAPRDNTVLELGLFIGSLGRERAVIVSPRGLDLKIPSDLLGLTPLEYEVGSPAELPTLLGPVCEEIRRLVGARGVK